uniref:Uncharacterized protein n=1 Tax=Anguilla anguilla TaxID=7936 RepID=A0A0E9RUL8_ANGAN
MTTRPRYSHHSTKQSHDHKVSCAFSIRTNRLSDLII